MQSVFFTTLAVLSLASLAPAQVLTSDDFNYTGALTSNGWTAHSAGGNKVIMSDGSTATLDQSSGSGEDVNLSFTALTATDTVYASFDLQIPSGTLVNPDALGLYFAHFKNSGTTYRGRTGVLSPTGGGDFVLAINADNADMGAGTAWPTDLSFDTLYKVVISWNAGNDESMLWLDPDNSSSPSISHSGTSTGALIEGFALRQSSDYTGLIDIDNVVVGMTFIDVCQGAPVNYCTAGTSSNGCQATLSASGVASATAVSGFTLTANGVEGQKTGVFYFRDIGRQANPWGNGSSYQCVVPPVYRGGMLPGNGTLGLCDGSISQDLNALWCSSCPKPAKNMGSGAVVDAQFWYRDPFSTSNQSTSLSDAIEFTVFP